MKALGLGYEDWALYPYDEPSTPHAKTTLNLVKVAKAHALLASRNYISPHDVKTIAHDVLRHRVMITYEAEAEGKTSDDVIDTILANVEVP